MFLNPICHWSGGARPLYIWAPGDILDVDKQNSQVPISWFTFYDTVAALTAAGIPAPTFLHPCQEASGSGTIYDVAGGGADLVATGNVRQGQRTPPIWDPVNRNFHGLYRRAVEADAALRTAGFVCGNASIGDPGTDSFAIFVVFRFSNANATRYGLVQKRTENLGPGWALTVTHANVILYVEDNAGHQVECGVYSTDRFGSQEVFAVLVYCNRVANQGRGWSSFEGWDPSTYDFSSLGANPVVSATPMSIFSGNAGSDFEASPSQILYHAMWIGAAADNVIANWEPTYRAIMVPQFGLVGNSPAPVVPGGSRYEHLGGAVNGYLSSIVGDDPTFGLTQATWVKANTSGNTIGQFPMAYDPNISRASKLVCKMIRESPVNISTYTDNVSGFSKSGVTVSTAWADKADDPAGFHQAMLCTATASPGYLQTNGSCAASSWYTMQFLHRRGQGMGSNVSGRLVAWDVTGAAEVASIAFTATDKWQETVLEFQNPFAASRTIAFRIEITTSGESIHVSKCSYYRYQYNSCPIIRANDNPTGPNVAGNDHYKQFGAPADAMDPDRGEIEIRARLWSQTIAYSLDRYLFCIREGVSTAGTQANIRKIWYNSSNQIVAEIKNNAAVVVATMTSPVLDMRTERLIRLRWDTAGLPSGNTAELIIDAAAPISGSVAGWVTGLNCDTYHFGALGVQSTASLWDGSINYVKVWAQPQ